MAPSPAWGRCRILFQSHRRCFDLFVYPASKPDLGQGSGFFEVWKIGKLTHQSQARVKALL